MTHAARLLQEIIEELIDKRPDLAPQCGMCGEKFIGIDDIVSIHKRGLCDECAEKYDSAEVEWHPLRADGREWS